MNYQQFFINVRLALIKLMNEFDPYQNAMCRNSTPSATRGRHTEVFCVKGIHPRKKTES